MVIAVPDQGSDSSLRLFSLFSYLGVRGPIGYENAMGTEDSCMGYWLGQTYTPGPNQKALEGGRTAGQHAIMADDEKGNDGIPVAAARTS